MSEITLNESIPQYDAFISYRHKELDTAVAKMIHKQLETYRIPTHIKKQTGKLKMGKVFRDQDELPLMADLGEGIREALQNSEWLIVVCSPDLPQSKWCMAEIDYFIELGRREKILTVLASGEPEESFPEQLRFAVGADGKLVEKEPLAADVRVKNDDKNQAVKKVKKEKLRLLAPMLGVGYDDLRRRQRERFLRTAATVSAIGFAFFAVLTTYVWRQNILLEQQKNASMTSQSLFLANLSGQKLAEGDISIATLLALEGLPKNLTNPERPFVPEAETALRQAMLQSSAPDYSLTMSNQSNYGDYFRRIFSSDGRALFCTQGQLDEYNLITGEHLRTLNGRDDCYAYSADGNYLLVGTTTLNELEDSNEIQLDSTIELYAKDDKIISSVEIKDASVDALGFAPSSDGTLRLWINGSSYFEVYHFNSISESLEIEFSLPKSSWTNLSGKEIEIYVSNIAWNPNGENLLLSLRHAAEGLEDSVILWDTKSWEQLSTFPLDVYNMEWSMDGTRLVFFTVDDGIQIWNAKLWEPITTLELQENYRRVSLYQNSYMPSLSPDGSKLALLSEEDAVLRIINCEDGSELSTIQDNQSAIKSFSWNSDSSQIVCVTVLGTAIIYDADSGNIVRDIGNLEKTVEDAVFLPQMSSKLALLQYNVPRINITEEERKIIEGVDREEFSLEDFKTLLRISQDQASSYPENKILEFVIWESKPNENFLSLKDLSPEIVELSFTTNKAELLLRVWANADEAVANTVQNITQWLAIDMGTHDIVRKPPSGMIVLQYSNTARYAVVMDNAKPNERAIYDTEEKILIPMVFSQTLDDSSSWKLRDTVILFSPDETKVKLLDSIFYTATGEEGYVLPTAYYTQFYDHSRFDWAPDSQMFAYSSGNEPASLYDINEKNTWHKLSVHAESPPLALSFSPDGSMLAVSTSIVSVLNVESGTVIVELAPACAIGFDIAWTSDNTKLLARHRYNNDVYLFNAENWKLVHMLPPCEKFTLSADGKMLLTNAGTIYDLITGKRVLTDKSEWVSSFAPSGLDYAIVVKDGVLLQNIHPLADVIADSKERLGGRELTTQERQQYFLE